MRAKACRGSSAWRRHGGLGMKITRALVDQMGARFEVKRPEHGGAEFILTIPLDAA